MIMSDDILICGDFMPGGVLYRHKSYADDGLIEFMKQHRYVIATLECAVALNDNYLTVSNEKAIPKVVVRKKDLERLYEMNVNVVSLANNHVFDLGTDAFDAMVQELDDHNVLHFGAGHNIEEASKPIVLTIDDKRIAIYGCCMEGIPPSRLVVATKDKPGIWRASMRDLITVVKSVRSDYDYILIMPHGGQEHKILPMQECLDMSKKMVDAGADGVFWSHAHCVQPMFMYRKRPIYFGLGSLLFPDVYVYPPRSVFYPDESFDFSQLSICKNFPKKVNKPTLARWETPSRKGIGVTVSLKNGIETVSSLFELTQDNVLKGVNESGSLHLFKSLRRKSLLFELPSWAYGAIRKMVY